MSSQNAINFASFQELINSEKILAHASEIHGLLCGFICGGIAYESKEYLPLVNDFFNNGEGLPIKLKTEVSNLYTQIWQQMLDGNYGFQLLVPDDDEDIVERCAALSAWVQGYNVGFGLQQKNKSELSDEVREVVDDFVEIANLSDEVEEDEATEQAYFEILEYARISSLLCFSEVGNPPKEEASKTLH